jgi:putative oxygen-independent coproporphyrinogen III oxidase
MDKVSTDNALPGLYVHWPWCVRKCPYCDFNSHQVTPETDEPAFVAALLADLDDELQFSAADGISSIFFGGGTPSLMSGDAVVALLDGVRARLPLTPDCEITLEANPGAVDAGHFDAYRKAGINRLSIGVQSFSAQSLSALGRIHSPDDARQAVQMARDAGFDNLNLDLMYGLPGQDVAGALDDLERAIACAPEHLSWYQLTLEPNTPFHHHPPVLPGEGLIDEINDAGLARLAVAGFARYEVSAFAAPGRVCRHNLNYWRFGDYLGIGPGAHGKRTLPDGQIVRRSKRRGPGDYLTGSARQRLSRQWALGDGDRVLEFMLNALRLVDGIEIDEFVRRTGLSREAIALPCAEAERLELLVSVGGRLRPTHLGQRYLNELLQLFMPD